MIEVPDVEELEEIEEHKEPADRKLSPLEIGRLEVVQQVLKERKRILSTTL